VGCILPFSVRRGRTHVSFAGNDRLALFFPLIWWGITVVFFSFLNQKKNAYLLPALPAQAMMIGQAAAALLEWARETRFKGAAGALVTVQTLVGVGFAIALGILVRSQPGTISSLKVIAPITL